MFTRQTGNRVKYTNILGHILLPEILQRKKQFMRMWAGTFKSMLLFTYDQDSALLLEEVEEQRNF